MSRQYKRAADLCRLMQALAPAHQRGCYDKCIDDAECMVKALVSGSALTCNAEPGSPCDGSAPPEENEAATAGASVTSSGKRSNMSHAPRVFGSSTIGGVDSRPPEVRAAMDGLQVATDQWLSSMRAANARQAAASDRHAARREAASKLWECYPNRLGEQRSLRTKQKSVDGCVVRHLYLARVPDLQPPPGCTSQALTDLVTQGVNALRGGDIARAVSSLRRASAHAPLWEPLTLTLALAVEASGDAATASALLEPVSAFVATQPAWSQASRAAARKSMEQCQLRVAAASTYQGDCR